MNAAQIDRKIAQAIVKIEEQLKIIGEKGDWRLDTTVKDASGTLFQYHPVFNDWIYIRRNVSEGTACLGFHEGQSMLFHALTVAQVIDVLLKPIAKGDKWTADDAYKTFVEKGVVSTLQNMIYR